MSSLGASMPNITGANSYSVPLSSPLQGSPTQHSPQQGSGGGGKREASGGGVAGGEQPLSRPRLQELVRELEPTVQLDEDVEELLLLLADDFIDSTLHAACQLAKHRRAPQAEARDVQLYLERQWNMWVPGVGGEELRAYKRPGFTEPHRQRLALIRKATKKY